MVRNYSKFTLEDLETRFQVRVKSEYGLFQHAPAHPISDLLRQTLEEHALLISSANTTKMRSELLVAPLLLDLWRQQQRQIGFFSGVEMDVEPETGLVGICDFLLTHARQQLFLTPPFLAVAQAKRDDLRARVPQCVAMMLAARLFSEREGSSLGTVYGVVTSGQRWAFLKLEGQIAHFDLQEHHIGKPDQILGILMEMANDGAKD